MASSHMATTRTIWCLASSCMESAEHFVSKAALAAHMSTVHSDVGGAGGGESNHSPADASTGGASSLVTSRNISTDRNRFIDIGANMTDPMFAGNYRGKQKHPSDFDAVLTRGRAAGVEKIIVTAGCISDAKEALALCASHADLFLTVGCHPTRCNEYAEAGTEAYEQGA
jgi:hypothetical protein